MIMYERAPRLEFRNVGDETLVHDMAQEKIHVLNRTAGDLLENCDRKTTIELAEFIRSRYDAAGTDVEADVREILDLFVEKGLVQRIPA